jgi:enamine deaminase RidA (YjgF/YER057c/UK114 family)
MVQADLPCWFANTREGDDMMKFGCRAVLLGAACVAAALMQLAPGSVARCVAAPTMAEEPVSRLPLPNDNPFPISAAVTVSAGTDLYFLSGAVPPMINKDAPKGSTAAYGDMETEATNALTAIKGTLERLGLTMGDVIKMTAFLVADPATGKLDFDGFMTGYKKFFATPEQPNKPARSAVQVAALVAPGALVEIEVVAAKPHKRHAKAMMSAK